MLIPSIRHLQNAHRHFARAGFHIRQAQELHKAYRKAVYPEATATEMKEIPLHLVLAVDALDRGLAYLAKGAAAEGASAKGLRG